MTRLTHALGQSSNGASLFVADDEDCESECEGGMLDIEASTAKLIVTTLDECCNLSFRTAVTCEPPEDDSPASIRITLDVFERF